MALYKSYIGIDIEKIDRFKDYSKFNEFFLDSQEKKYINKLLCEKEIINTVSHIWTIKEAILKCLGKGLNILPNEIHLKIELGSHFNQSQNINYLNNNLHIIPLCIKKYSAHIAINVPIKIPDVILFDLCAL